jgi:hypothetical protein
MQFWHVSGARGSLETAKFFDEGGEDIIGFGGVEPTRSTR